jgi:NADH dehydrogenase
VLVGCSFGGLEFLYRYARRAGAQPAGALTVIDPRARHPYIPLAHEALSEARADEALYFDARAFCEAVGATFIQSEAVAVCTRRRVVTLASGAEVTYDRLVLAVGSVADVPAALPGREAAQPVKFVADAVALRERLRRRERVGGTPPRVVVAGGGITGTEWAAELAGAGVDGERVQVTVVQRAPTLLPSFAPGVARRAARVLHALDARVVTGRSIAAVDAGGATLDDGTRLPADAVVWAGGVRPAPLVATLAAQGAELTAGGHLAVTTRLAVRGLSDVYAVGDAARVVTGPGADPWPTMERAIEAIWQGALLGRRLAAGHGVAAGPAHRLRRDFFYGLSLGPRHSLLVYKRFVLDSPFFAWFRRWLQWAYYARFRLLARARGRRTGAAAATAAPAG